MGITFIFTTLASTKATYTVYAPYKAASECNRVSNFLALVYQVITGRKS